MSTRIVIQHQTGSKAHQVEQFPLDTTSELTIGRDPASNIAFDPQRDDAVSRRHAVIRIVRGDPPGFRISDLGSSNGTYVNGARIATETELMPTDTVQLGNVGPSFTFDLDPRPTQVPARTRIIDVPEPRATRVSEVVGVTTAASTAAGPTKVGVGRETVARLLSDERRSTRKVWTTVLAIVLALVVAGGGGFYYHVQKQNEAAARRLEEQNREAARRQDELNQEAAKRQEEQNRRTAAALALQKQELIKQTEDQNRELASKIGVTPSEILQKYGNSTVYIEVGWRVYDHATGKPLFHKTCQPPFKDAKLLPCYIKMAKEPRLVRWLTTEDEGHTNNVVGGNGAATGFVITDSGFILTNKHVAAAWMINYNQFIIYDESVGYACAEGADPRDKRTWDKGACQQIDSPNQIAGSVDWRPEVGGVLFDANRAIAVAGGDKRAFEGRNDRLEVRFPGSRLSLEGRLVRASSDADVALMRIDSAQSLTPVVLAPDDNVTVGGNITVLGYPGASVKTYAVTQTIENAEFHRSIEVVPEPTVTPGTISRTSVAREQGVLNGGTVGGEVISGVGDVYQLTAATSAGNSGGPVFDANGKVIGLFTYSTRKEAVTLAVPIRYARDLMPVQRGN